MYAPFNLLYVWLTLKPKRLLLLICGYAWLFVLPLPQFGQRTYIDENALQPGQVRNTTLTRTLKLMN